MADPTVVLLHGAWHRGSCWAPLQEALAERSLRSVAPDLPTDRPGLGAADYATAVSLPEGELVVVGHSLGGLTAPVLAARAADRVRALVLVAAMVPEPGRSHMDLVKEDPSILPRPIASPTRNADGTTSWSVEAALGAMYAGVPPELAEPAVARLRPQAWTVTKEVTPLQAWPAVPTTSVVCAADPMAAPEASRRIARERGFTLRELPGDHFPMLTRPRELAEIIASA
ncbi:alpha/beta fold hydrolase [Pseudonocardia oroxyli]|uniref:Pimeloyl-ACP methyl ester carboxylesterase n=1 Tax=Pseudonocardia oroxyli TaxID=366584 RepID=A0A1G7N4Y9_PSEOR|nr:alpha/beta hydrolase [Pseudonocardia oroxyli]SDF68419.1 Pimeloyl-ACP methyl ester carboxylesterase [Pseudonocardia oroxyli]